tara:strand:+ start:6328 stop:6783 length:456 start_codon:yes stop_codon:yes gene_type:complete
MEVILLEKIENLGNLGDKINVKSGYARNYLIPQGKAKFLTPENLEEFEKIRSELEKKEKEKQEEAIKRKESLDGFTINITSETNDEGVLYGSIGPNEIMRYLTEKEHNVEKKEIRMPEGLIKKIGEYQVIIHLGTDTDASINLIVESNNQT